MGIGEGFPLASAFIFLLLQTRSANSDSNKQAFCDAVRNDVGLYGMVNCTHSAFPQALRPYMNFCKGNISGNVTYERHFRNLCEVEGYDTQVQACMTRKMEEVGQVIRIQESEVSAYTECINAVERRVHDTQDPEGDFSKNTTTTTNTNITDQPLEQPNEEQDQPETRSKRDTFRHPYFLQLAMKQD